MRPRRIAKVLRRSDRSPASFGRFYEEYFEPILGYCIRRTWDVDTGWDVTSEVFARAFAKRASFRGSTDAEAKAWIFTIAEREILQRERRRATEASALKRLGVEVPALTPEEEERALELAGLAELREAVRAELSELSENLRHAVELKVLAELPYEEVAERLGVSQQTARARVSRGVRAIRKSLEAGEPTLVEDFES